MSAELKTLITKRASIRGRLTKFEKYLDLLQNIPILSELQVNEIALKLQTFYDLKTEFSLLQDQIDQINSDNIDDEIDERDKTDSQITKAIALAETIFNKYKTKEKPSESGSASSRISLATVNVHQSHHQPNFKLPQIQIAKFNGNYSKWLDFRDTYTSLIHDNDRLLPVHKFHYLNSYLEGEAARVLSNLEVSNAHYQEAWDLICQRYDNKRYLTNNHLNSLFNIEQVQRESDKSLRALVDQVNKDLRALSSLGHPTSQWDTLIIHIMTNKLDYHTKRDWEEHRNTINNMPSLSQLTKFLHDRADVLESCHTKKQYSNTNCQAINSTIKNERSYKSLSCTTHNNSADGAKIQTTWVCNYCSGDHSIYNCSKFLLLSIEQRKLEVMKLKLCLNCLKKGHSLRECRRGPCRECRKRHNTLLHTPLSQPGGSSISAQPAFNTPSQDVSVNFSASQTAYQVLLSTATIKVTNPYNNNQTTVRCLLDSGSQSTFMTKALQQKLELESIPTVPMKIMGVANIPCGSISERSVVRLNSLCTDYNVTQACGVLPELTDKVPKQFIDKRYFNLPPKLQLADPTFNISAPVEMLIGADLFWQIVGNEQRCLGANLPYLRSSQFGWLISGPIFNSCEPRSIKCNFSRTDTSDNLDDKISRFWELEELPKRPLLSSSEKECELHFNTHTFRQEDGRFVVKLPFKDSPDKLGDSYYRARQRFLSLERKFRKDLGLKKAYSEFIAEYGELRHCSPVEGQPPQARCHYLCHHAVLRAQSESTKLRVVFDGSAPTSTGVSINDIQHTGPKVQDSLFAILLRFRSHKYVLAGDIDKFFRQVLVHEQDRNLQLILWREDEKQQLKTIRLNTVTYGFASASYLSTKCLWTLGDECQDEMIKQIIQKDFYCDDMLTGSDTKADLLHILNAVTTHLKTGCFNLRKFKSNAPDIFPISTVDLQGKLSLSDASNALGLGWSPQTDELFFTIEAPTCGMQEKITKRTILSSTFSIYDPLGLLSPCTVQPKLLMQQLWRRGLDWDEPVPDDLEKEWKKITTSLSSLANITIPRRALSGDPVEIQVHSFCDASMQAYGACIYLRCKDKEANVSVNLLCAKSRVAPTKPPLTIPKLELLGALLAANLTKSVLDSLRCAISSCTHWCDSNVVLAWLHSSPSKLKSFVANKVVEICEHTCVSAWRHVPGSINPADVLSRGAPADQLAGNELWWRGPAFLSADDSQWLQASSETKKLDNSDLPEIIVLPSTNSDCDNPFIPFENFSTLGKLQRTYAYVLRLKHNLKNKNNKLSGPLSVQEIDKSFLFLATQAQKQSFDKEYHALSTKQDIASKSNILSLNPFLDKEGVMRVGGRLNRSTYSHEKRHPIILDSTHHFTKLIFQHEHIRLMHAGPQHLLYSIRDSIWPVCGRKLARTTVHRCVTCRRHRGQTLTPMMGDLPPQRVTPALPFQTIGMDFAGPFNIASKKGRGARLSKCYLCLFICQAYKCVHLEAVSELSKDAFLLTLRRFVSRRGKPLEIFCDNGRNFTAASKEVGQFLKNNSNAISELATNLHIKFNFHPPYAPHFSGLAEAGIKSAKHHIKRVMGNSNLTFEELSTLFAQVEGIMNSRPLSPLSSHPTDYLPLSPAHFIIGRPLTSVPTPAINDTRASRSRYETIERMRQQFWRRWQHEYISELQQRTKWKRNMNTLQLNDMVLIQEDNVPPLNWRLGRIEKLIPGKDGISRVADIRTARGTIRRALTRLCPLPNENY